MKRVHLVRVAGALALWLLAVIALHLESRLPAARSAPGGAVATAARPSPAAAASNDGAAWSLGPERLASEASGGNSREAEETPFEKELRLLAEHDPAAAARRLGELNGPWPADLAAAVASAWGKRDPAAAAAWARSQPAGEVRDQALLSLAGDWSAAEPWTAAEGAMTLLPEPRQGEFLRLVGLQWAQKDLDSALAWAGGLPDGPLRDDFVAGVSSTLAETAPAQAAALVAAMTPGTLQDAAALSVVLDWGREQPQAAAAWVKQFPSGTLRERALENLAVLWSEPTAIASPCPLLDWPRGPELDQAIRHTLDQLVDSQPSRAVPLLSAITDEGLRQEETERLAQYWLVQDRPAATQWLEQTPLSQPTKDRLYAAQSAFR